MLEAERIPAGKVLSFNGKTRSKEQLLKEIEELRRKVKGLEEAETRRQAVETALKNRLAMEKLVASISTRFINIPLEEIDREIERALRAIGEFAGVDQCFFCLLTPDGKKIETAYFWASQVNPEKVKVVYGLCREPYEWVMGKLRKFETVFVQTVNGLPVEASPEKKILQDQEIRSIMAIPLSYHEELIGLMGLNLLQKDKPWAEEDISLLKVMGEILVNVFARKRMEVARRESEQRYRIVSKISTDGASSLRLEKDGTFVREWITESLSRIFGISPEEINSYGSYASFIHPEDLPLFHRLLSRLPKSKEPLTAELRALTRSGEVRWLRIVIHPEWDEGEQRVVRLVNAVQDITERKRAEEELRKSEERYRYLVKNAPLGIISTNRQGQVVEANSTLLRVLELPAEETGKAINVLSFAPLVEAGMAADFQRCLERGESTVHERPYKGKAGKEMHLRYHLTPLRDGNGLMTGLQAIVEDITERKRLENQLLQAQKIEAIGTLAGGIAHDFNNILAGIIGYGELLGFEVGEGSHAHTCLEELLKAAQRAKELVKQILAFSRRNDQEKGIISIEPIVRESFQLLRASLPATVQFQPEIEEDLGTIRANPTQMQQVVMNLGTNAAHALPDGGGVISIKLGKVEFDGEGAWKIPGLPPGPYIRLTVSDPGHGMPPEVIRRIFDPYFTTKERGKGTGLGLAVIHGIIKNHDGAITVESEVGRGTTFEIYLPKVSGLEKTEGPVTGVTAPTSGRERILYVDDEQLVAHVGKQMLEKLGYEVIPMLDSRQALEAFRAQPDRFDLVVTDMTMPNLTGDKLALEIMGIRANTPIVLCTGYSERMTERKAKELGIREYLSKPFVMNDLAQAVRRALGSPGSAH